MTNENQNISDWKWDKFADFNEAKNCWLQLQCKPRIYMKVKLCNLRESERTGYFMFMYNKPYVLPDTKIMNLPFPQTSFTFQKSDSSSEKVKNRLITSTVSKW